MLSPGCLHRISLLFRLIPSTFIPVQLLHFPKIHKINKTSTLVTIIHTYVHSQLDSNYLVINTHIHTNQDPWYVVSCMDK